MAYGYHDSQYRHYEYIHEVLVYVLISRPIDEKTTKYGILYLYRLLMSNNGRTLDPPTPTRPNSHVH